MFGDVEKGLYKFNIQRVIMRTSDENYWPLLYWDVSGQDRRLLYYHNKGPPKGLV